MEKCGSFTARLVGELRERLKQLQGRVRAGTDEAQRAELLEVRRHPLLPDPASYCGGDATAACGGRRDRCGELLGARRRTLNEAAAGQLEQRAACVQGWAPGMSAWLAYCNNKAAASGPACLLPAGGQGHR